MTALASGAGGECYTNSWADVEVYGRPVCDWVFVFGFFLSVRFICVCAFVWRMRPKNTSNEVEAMVAADGE